MKIEIGSVLWNADNVMLQLSRVEAYFKAGDGRYNAIFVIWCFQGGHLLLGLERDVLKLKCEHVQLL